MTAKPEAFEELELKPLLLELLGKATLKLTLPPLGQLNLFTWVQGETLRQCSLSSLHTNLTNGNLLTFTSLGKTLELIFFTYRCTISGQVTIAQSWCISR